MSMNNEKASLKKQMLALLGDEETDYGELLEKASKLSEYDDDNIRFTVDANLVKRLGEQLVAKKTTAVSELIKNAYDADATSVSVKFKDTHDIGGMITISDNGNGMTRQQLINGFMKISTSDKEDEPISPKFKRQRAGKKGIGRFSAQKLGDKLKIITKRKELDYALVIEIDWSKFQKNKNITTVSNKLYKIKDAGIEHGTIFIIENTKEPWQLENISTTYAYILSIVQKNSFYEEERSHFDPGFDVVMSLYSELLNNYEIIANQDSEALSEADAFFEAWIDANGNGNVSVSSKKYGIENEVIIIPNSEIDSIHKSLFEAKYKLQVHYFPQSKGDKLSRAPQQYLSRNSGIKLYRNGFRLAPYGEKFNDWLSLDDSSRRRAILPPHANGNFVGHVELFDYEGSIFEETSSREGLIENDEFEALRDFTYRALTMAVIRYSSERKVKVKANQKNHIPALKSSRAPEEELKIKIRDLQEKVKDVIDVTLKVSDAGSQSLDIFELGQISNNAISLEDDIKTIEELTAIVVDEKSLFKVLSAMGLAIGEFTHEIQLFLTNLDLNTSDLLKEFKGNVELKNKVETVNNNLEMLRAYTDFFDSTMRKNSQRHKNILEIRQIINSFFKSMQPSIERKQFIVEIDYDSYGIWTKPIHESEMSSVLINLFTNSSKAIYRAGAHPGKLGVFVSTNDDEILIRFEDNGDGISLDKREKVFNALYTTALPNAAYSQEEESLRGMGLGLSIVKDIIDGLDGSIYVTEPSEGYNTCFEIKLPRASAEEIPDDIY